MKLFHRRFPAIPEQLKSIREAVREAGLRAGCTSACVQDIVIAVDEACQNIIRHAYGAIAGGEIVLEIEVEGDHLVLWLTDFAPKVDESKVKSRDLDDVRPGGLGVHLIREIMDECGFAHSESEMGNVFRMTKRIS